jgi:hypothetical protein
MYTNSQFEHVLKGVEDDLTMCEEYTRTGTLQAAFRYLNDLRSDLLLLTSLVKELYDRNSEPGV